MVVRMALRKLPCFFDYVLSSILSSRASLSASFYSSPLIGATTTLACFAHEIPHEIADYSILIRSGFTKRQAMQSQYLTAVGAFVSFTIPCTSRCLACLFVYDRYHCPGLAYHFICEHTLSFVTGLIFEY